MYKIMLRYASADPRSTIAIDITDEEMTTLILLDIPKLPFLTYTINERKVTSIINRPLFSAVGNGLSDEVCEMLNDRILEQHSIMTQNLRIEIKKLSSAFKKLQE